MYFTAFSQSQVYPAGAAAALVDGNSNGAEPEPKKKKKRSYANAYTRKGEGLAAAIKSMKTAAAEVKAEPTAIEVKAEPTEDIIEVPRKKRTKRKQAPAEVVVEGVEPSEMMKQEEPEQLVAQVNFICSSKHTGI